MATKTSIGWAILVFSLLVPGALFYQWRAHLDKAQKQALSLKVRSRIPEGGPFDSSPNKNKLINPIAQETPSISTPPATRQDASPGAPVPEGGRSPLPETAAAQEPRSSQGGRSPSPETTATPTEASPEPAAATPPREASAPPLSEPVVAASSQPMAGLFASWRDPTISPNDQVRLDRAESEKQMKLQELMEAMQKARHPRKKRLSDVEKNIELQGIVAKTEGGNRAIVNGHVVKEGDTIESVKVLRITPRTVIFGYNNKKFSRSLSR